MFLARLFLAGFIIFIVKALSLGKAQRQ